MMEGDNKWGRSKRETVWRRRRYVPEAAERCDDGIGT
jgi:hypothetical protein